MASDVAIHVEGPAAEDVAAELESLFDEQFGHIPQRRRSPAVAVPGTREDPVAVMALILAIPPSLLATLELAERVKLKAKVETLLAWAKEAAVRFPGTTVRLQRANRIVRLDRAEVPEILDGGR